jgi:hypothetical protein
VLLQQSLLQLLTVKCSVLKKCFYGEFQLLIFKHFIYKLL